MFEQNAAAENVFHRDILAFREGCRDSLVNLDPPALGNPALSIDLLQSLLAAEIVCVTRYTLLAISEDGLKNEWMANEFQAQANDERRHVAMLAGRIEALGGQPAYNPAGIQSRIDALGRCHESFAIRLRQNLAAEQCVVGHYRDLIRHFDRHDPTTASILRDILQDEENHSSDMQDLLASCAG